MSEKAHRKFHSYYSIGLKRDEKRKINITHYSHKYNQTKTIKPIGARQETIMQNFKDLMLELDMNKLEVKLKE